MTEKKRVIQLGGLRGFAHLVDQMRERSSPSAEPLQAGDGPAPSWPKDAQERLSTSTDRRPRSS